MNGGGTPRFRCCGPHDINSGSLDLDIAQDLTSLCLETLTNDEQPLLVVLRRGLKWGDGGKAAAPGPWT